MIIFQENCKLLGTELRNNAQGEKADQIFRPNCVYYPLKIIYIHTLKIGEYHFKVIRNLSWGTFNQMMQQITHK